MPKIAFTDVSIRNLKNQKTQIDYFDASLPSFGIRVGARLKTWICMHGTPRTREKLGVYPHMPLKIARQQAIYGARRGKLTP